MLTKEPDGKPEDWSDDFFDKGQYQFYGLWLRGQNREQDALAVFLEAARRTRLWQPYFATGISYLTLKRPKDAVVSFKKAIAINPNISAWDGLGRAYCALQKYEESIHSYQEGLKISPDSFATYIHMGDTYRLIGDTESALNSYRTASYGNGKGYITGNIRKAELLVELGRYREAIDTLSPKIEAHPKMLDIRQVLARAYFRAGQNQDALRECQAIIDRRAHLLAVGETESDLLELDPYVIEANQIVRSINTQP